MVHDYNGKPLPQKSHKMAEREPHVRLNLQRQIQQHLNDKYGYNRQTGRHAKLGFAARSLMVLLPAMALPVNTQAQIAEHDEWHCKPMENGSGWECSDLTDKEPGLSHDSEQAKAATTADAKITHSTSELDWVPLEQLPEAQRTELPAGCCGAYIEPKRTDPEAHLDPEKATLRATAEKAKMVQESTTVMEGEVKLTQGTRQLLADNLIMNRATNEAQIVGNIRLREPGLLLRGERATMNLDSRHATLSNAEFVIHESRARGSAEKLEHRENNVVVLEKGSYTTCEPNSNAWILKGREIVIDPNFEQGEGRHVSLEVKGVPVFYTPYIFFPTSDARQSGLLFPYISTSGSGGGGLNAGIPYYYNLAPNYDMTLTPRHIDDRGEMMELEFRHLSPNFETVFNMAHLGNDKGGKDNDDEKRLEEAQAELDLATNAEDTTPQELLLLQEEVEELEARIGEFIGEDRWLINVDQTGGLSKRWGTRIDFTRISDRDYFRDLDTASLTVNSQTHLKRLGEASYQFDNWLLKAKAEEFQSIGENIEDINSPYRQTPRINADGHYQFDDWVLEFEHEYVSFDHKLKQRKITGDRARIDYRVAWEKQWVWGFAKPAFALKHLSYRLDDDFDHGIEDDPELFVPQGTFDTGLFFEREGRLLGEGYQQTLEPRLFYFYSDFEDQTELSQLKFDTTPLTNSYNQLFRDTRFSGGDRIDDANQLSVGLTTRFIEADSGVERLSLSVGQIYYFQDRRVFLTQPQSLAGEVDPLASRSEVAAQITAQVGDYWRLNSDLLYDEEQQEMSRGNMSLKYMDDRYRLFNLGYRYVRQAGKADSNDFDNDGDTSELLKNDIDQVEASMLWPVYGNWSLIGRYNKDFTNDRELETFAGLEYDSCCYRVRAVWRRWLDNDLINIVDDRELDFDEGVFFEFQLKGLGGTGNTVNSVLSEGIQGYDLREKFKK